MTPRDALISLVRKFCLLCLGNGTDSNKYNPMTSKSDIQETFHVWGCIDYC